MELRTAGATNMTTVDSHIPQDLIPQQYQADIGRFNTPSSITLSPSNQLEVPTGIPHIVGGPGFER